MNESVRSAETLHREMSDEVPAVEVLDGCVLDDATVRAANAVRLRQFRRRERLDPETDHRNFARTLRRCNLTTLIRVGTQLVGFLASELRYRSWTGGAGWVYHTRYVFIDPEWRGRTAYQAATIKRILTIMLRRPLTPLYIYGTAFKASYVNLSRTWDGIDSSADTRVHDPSAANLVQHMLAVEDRDHFDTVRRVNRMPGVPRSREGNRRWKPRDQPAADRYEQLNPHWREGYALPVAVRLRPTALIRRSVLGR